MSAASGEPHRFAGRGPWPAPRTQARGWHVGGAPAHVRPPNQGRTAGARTSRQLNDRDPAPGRAPPTGLLVAHRDARRRHPDDRSQCCDAILEDDARAIPKPALKDGHRLAGRCVADLEMTHDAVGVGIEDMVDAATRGRLVLPKHHLMGNAIDRQAAAGIQWGALAQPPLVVDCARHVPTYPLRVPVHQERCARQGRACRQYHDSLTIGSHRQPHPPGTGRSPDGVAGSVLR